MPSQDKTAQTSPFEIITPGKSKGAGKTGIIVGVAVVIFLILSVVAGVLLVRQQQNISEKAAGSMCPAAEACPLASQPNLLMSCHPVDSDGTTTDSLCNQAGRVETCGAASTKYCCPVAGGSWTTNMSACPTSPTPTATSVPTATPRVTPTATPTTRPSGTPTATPTAAPGATATATPTSSPTTAPTATPNSGGANSCNGTCGSNSNCQSGLYCYLGYCRSANCPTDTSCGCNSVTAAPAQTTPLPIPVTGTDWATYAGVGVGAAAIIVSILLAL
jgi:hypothetical protein